MVNYKPLLYFISTIKQTLVTAKLFDLLSVKPFILTLGTMMCFRITIIWFFHQVVIGWPLNLTSCGYSKFMNVICESSNSYSSNKFQSIPEICQVELSIGVSNFFKCWSYESSKGYMAIFLEIGLPD